MTTCGTVLSTVCTTPTRIELGAGAAEPVQFTVVEQNGVNISADPVLLAFTKGDTGEPASWLTPEPVSAIGSVIVVRLRMTRAILPTNGYYTAWWRLTDGSDIWIRRMTRAVFAA